MRVMIKMSVYNQFHTSMNRSVSFICIIYARVKIKQKFIYIPEVGFKETWQLPYTCLV